MRRAAADVLLFLFFPVWTLNPFPLARADDRADDMLAAIALFDRQQAQVQAAAFCQTLNCGEAVTVSVEPDDRFAREVVAHTTRGEGGTGCTIHVRKRWVVLEDVIAHEVCHCTYDYEVLGTYGYVVGVGKKERAERERAAQACGEKLMKRREGE